MQTGDNQHKGVKQRPAYLRCQIASILACYSQDDNFGASIYGDRKVLTLGRMMVATEL